MKYAVPKEALWGLGLLSLLVLQVALLARAEAWVAFHFPWENPLGDVVGRALSAEGPRQRRPVGALVWSELASGDLLRDEETLRTGPGARIKLLLRGKGEAEMGPRTLATFTLVESRKLNVVSVALREGLLTLRADEKAGSVVVEGTRFDMKAGTELHVSKRALNARAQVQVKKGEVMLAAFGSGKRGAGQTGSAGEALELSPDRGVLRLQTKLAISPKYPSPGSRVFVRGSREPVDFSWSGDEGESVELATTVDFLSPQTVRAGGNSAQGDLTPGRYFWRVRRDVAVSPPVEFTVVPRLQYRARTPASGDVLVRRPETVGLAWDPIPGAVAYRVQASDSPEFGTPFFDRVLKESETKVRLPAKTGLKGSPIYWRLAAQHPQWGDLPWSETYSFQVKAKGKKPKARPETNDPAPQLAPAQ